MSYPRQQTAQISRSAFSGVFILIFLFLALTISISGYVYYLSVQKVVKDGACRQLSAVADLKAGQIKSWRRDLRRIAEVLRSNPYLAESTGDQTDFKLLRFFQSVQQQYRYRSIALLDTDGAFILAVGADAGVQDATDIELVRRAAHSGEVLLSDFHRIKSTNSNAPDRIQLDLVAPINPVESANSRPKRVIQISIDPQVFIYPLIQTWPGLSNSAETLLIHRLGDAVVFLNELRHRQGTALNLQFPVNRTNLPAVKAVAGVEGIVEGMDYRGIPVMAAVRKIPDSPWFMVSKVDAREVYAPVKKKGWLVTFVSILLIIAAGAAVQGFWVRHNAEFTRRQMAAEKERDALAGKYDYLSRYANDVILLSDQNGRILEANEKALEVYEYTREELLNKHLEDLWIPRSPKDAASLETVQIEDGALLEAMHRDRQGARFWVEISSRIVETESGRRYQSIIRDISDRKAAESALRKLNSELEAANRELEAFAYSVSHDLRSPLRGIDGYSKILLEDYKERLDGDGRFVLCEVRNAAQEMGALIDDLLEYSRLGRCELKRVTVDMNTLFKEIFEEFQQTLQHRRLVLELGPLPVVMGDGLLLRSVVRNLLDNAVKFTESCDPAVITVGTCQKPEPSSEFTFFVRDNGVGFDMRYAHKLFGVFQRLHTKDEFEGCGVGLANVKRIIERHGGWVWAEAEPDAGAVFYFSLPRRIQVAPVSRTADLHTEFLP